MDITEIPIEIHDILIHLIRLPNLIKEEFCKRITEISLTKIEY